MNKNKKYIEGKNFSLDKFIVKPLTKFDYVLFFCIAILCFLSFLSWDIAHTGGSSFAYLNGHFLDFYEYNLQFVSANNYMPSSFILFAIWNIPIKLLGVVNDQLWGAEVWVVMWYKLLPTLFYMASGVIMYKIGTVIGIGDKKSKLMMYIFLTTPIAFFSQFIFGQYDSFTIFFMLVGIFYYCKDDIFKFALFFGISITFKYFPVFIFVPMLLLKEKNYWKIIKTGILTIIPFLIELVLYIGSKAFINGVFGFKATKYILKASVSTTGSEISIVLVIWIAVCAWAYFTDIKGSLDNIKWMIYFDNIIIFIIFGLSFWHPQWLLFAVPFMVIGMMINKKPDVFLILDILIMAAMIVFTVNAWVVGLDQTLFTAGIFGDKIGDTINNGLMMRDIFIIRDRNLVFTVFSGLLLVSAIFKHPKYCLDNFQEPIDKYWSLVRARFLIGVSIFVIPAFICFFVALGSPTVMNGRITELNKIMGNFSDNKVIEQYFIAERETIEKIGFAVGTYARENKFDLKVLLIDVETNKILYENNIKTEKLKDNEKCIVKIPEVQVEMGKQYKISFVAKNTSDGNTVAIYQTAEGITTEGVYAAIDGVKQSYNLSVDIYGR